MMTMRVLLVGVYLTTQDDRVDGEYEMPILVCALERVALFHLV